MAKGQGRPYSALGKVMDEPARSRDVRGPHKIGTYMEEKLGDAPTGTAVAKWANGDAEPKPDKIQMFAKAFLLTEEENLSLA